MKRMPHLSRGFSLIELLVSLMVLALLIGVLLPGLHHAARVSAPLVKCSNNLSQLYRSVNLYMSDSNDLLPNAGYQPLREGRNPRLDITLKTYGAAQGMLWLCPLDPRVQSNPRQIGSYLYPPAKVQAANIRVFMSNLPQQFPIFSDRNSFHAVERLTETLPTMENGRSGQTLPRNVLFRYNPGAGYNRVNSNGKITAYPSMVADTLEDIADDTSPAG